MDDLLVAESPEGVVLEDVKIVEPNLKRGADEAFDEDEEEEGSSSKKSRGGKPRKLKFKLRKTKKTKKHIKKGGMHHGKHHKKSMKQKGGKRKTKKFKKHYMFNTKGKRYVAKTRKQHLKGVKLGHTHTKPHKKSKK